MHNQHKKHTNHKKDYQKSDRDRHKLESTEYPPTKSSSSTKHTNISNESKVEWQRYVTDTYEPIKVGSIDGTDTYPHDHGIIRAQISNYRINDRVIGTARHTVFIGRLHIKTNEEKLKYKFRKCGRIVRCRIVRDIITGHSKSYGFIEFEKRSEASEAVNSMDKTLIDDCEIVVDYECERTLKGWKPRRLGGGFGGKKESGQLRFGGRARPFQRPHGIDNNEFTTTKSTKSSLNLSHINNVSNFKDICRNIKYKK